jgi:Fe-S oxidoreductase
VRVQDIGQQLESIGFRNGAYSGSERTTYDASCHLLHGQHASTSSMKMLWAIPDLNFAPLRDSEVCCGGAGVYNLLEPELSEQVLADKFETSSSQVRPSWRLEILDVICKSLRAQNWRLNLQVCHQLSCWMNLTGALVFMMS